MIEPALIEEMWQAGRWPMTTRGLRRLYVALSAGIGFFWLMFVPFQLLAMLLSGDDGRRELVGPMALCLGIGVGGVTVAFFLRRMWAPGDRADAALKANGARVTGQLVKKRYAPAAPGSIQLVSFYLFGAEAPDGTPVFARMTARNGIPLGAPATIAYDPARPGAGVVVETRAQLGRKR